MHFYEFLQLNETEQIELLWYNGEQIGRRKDEDHLILLYQVEGFYVEVFYHNKERAIKKYVSFECIERLDPYLEQIDLSPIYRQIKKQTRTKEPDLGESQEASVFEHLPTEQDTEGKKSRTGFWGMLLSLLGFEG